MQLFTLLCVCIGNLVILTGQIVSYQLAVRSEFREGRLARSTYPQALASNRAVKRRMQDRAVEVAALFKPVRRYILLE